MSKKRNNHIRMLERSVKTKKSIGYSNTKKLNNSLSKVVLSKPLFKKKFSLNMNPININEFDVF